MFPYIATRTSRVHHGCEFIYFSKFFFCRNYMLLFGASKRISLSYALCISNDLDLTLKSEFRQLVLGLTISSCEPVSSMHRGNLALTILIDHPSSPWLVDDTSLPFLLYPPTNCHHRSRALNPEGKAYWRSFSLLDEEGG
jgi:hypothetical protein